MNVSNAGETAGSRDLLSTRGLEVLLAVFAILWIPFALYYFIPNTAATSSTITRTSQASTQSGSVYRLTLMEIMDTQWNSSIAQPQFFVMGPSGMVPSASISLPARTLIQLTIVSYDTPTENSTDQMGVVNGTVGGNVYLINGTVASMEDVPASWGQNVTAVPGGILAHTITIPQLGVNIPVVGGDTTVAYLYFTKTGTFAWYCATPCGFGPTGMDGAMAKAGWMTGQIVVQ